MGAGGPEGQLTRAGRGQKHRVQPREDARLAPAKQAGLKWSQTHKGTKQAECLPEAGKQEARAK